MPLGDAEDGLGDRTGGQAGRGGDHGLARGQVGQQGRRALGVELGEHVVEEQERRGVEDGRDATGGREPEGQGDAALLALRRVGAGRHPVEGHLELVAVRAHQAHAAAQLVAPGLRQRGQQPTRTPRRLVAER